MIMESHIGGGEGREMGRFVGDRIFPKEHRRTGVYTTTCFCNDERNTTCVCCVCACVQYMYMYLHIYSGFIWSAGIISVDLFPLFLLCFHVRYLSYLMYVHVPTHVCIASATYPFYR